MSVAEDLAEELSIWDLTGDLTTYAEAIGQMFAQVELFAEDTDEQVGWQPLFDVNLMPTYGLPWLAQVVGERLRAGISDEAARQQIRTMPNHFRGTPEGIVRAVQVQLTGQQLVWMRERWNGNEEAEDWISVATYAIETPDEQAVLNALRRAVPADIDIAYQRLTGNTWAQLQTPVTTWAGLEATYGPTWADVHKSVPASVLYGKPA